MQIPFYERLFQYLDKKLLKIQKKVSINHQNWFKVLVHTYPQWCFYSDFVHCCCFLHAKSPKYLRVLVCTIRTGFHTFFRTLGQATKFYSFLSFSPHIDPPTSTKRCKQRISHLGGVA